MMGKGKEQEGEDILLRLEACLMWPENQVCADCTEPNPTMVSLLLPPEIATKSFFGAIAEMQGKKAKRKEKKVKDTKRMMGVFCCKKCISYHMLLGKEVCEIKNIILPNQWTEEAMSALELSGNQAANACYEAKMEDEKEAINALTDIKQKQDERCLLVQQKYQDLTYFCEETYGKYWQSRNYPDYYGSIIDFAEQFGRNALPTFETRRKELAEKQMLFKSFAEVQDRMHHFRLYRSCFVASQVIDTLVEAGIVETREAAVQMGRELQTQLGLFQHVGGTGVHLFKDEYLLFKFRKSKKGKKQADAATQEANDEPSEDTSNPKVLDCDDSVGGNSEQSEPRAAEDQTEHARNTMDLSAARTRHRGTVGERVRRAGSGGSLAALSDRSKGSSHHDLNKVSSHTQGSRQNARFSSFRGEKDGIDSSTNSAHSHGRRPRRPGEPRRISGGRRSSRRALSSGGALEGPSAHSYASSYLGDDSRTSTDISSDEDDSKSMSRSERSNGGTRGNLGEAIIPPTPRRTLRSISSHTGEGVPRTPARRTRRSMSSEEMVPPTPRRITRRSMSSDLGGEMLPRTPARRTSRRSISSEEMQTPRRTSRRSLTISSEEMQTPRRSSRRSIGSEEMQTPRRTSRRSISSEEMQTPRRTSRRSTSGDTGEEMISKTPGRSQPRRSVSDLGEGIPQTPRRSQQRRRSPNGAGKGSSQSPRRTKRHSTMEGPPFEGGIKAPGNPQFLLKMLDTETEASAGDKRVHGHGELTLSSVGDVLSEVPTSAFFKQPSTRNMPLFDRLANPQVAKKDPESAASERNKKCTQKNYQGGIGKLADLNCKQPTTVSMSVSDKEDSESAASDGDKHCNKKNYQGGIGQLAYMNPKQPATKTTTIAPRVQSHSINSERVPSAGNIELPSDSETEEKDDSESGASAGDKKDNQKTKLKGGIGAYLADVGEVLSEVSSIAEYKKITNKSISVSDTTAAGHTHDSFCYEGGASLGCISLPSKPEAEEKDNSESATSEGEKKDSHKAKCQNSVGNFDMSVLSLADDIYDSEGEDAPVTSLAIDPELLARARKVEMECGIGKPTLSTVAEAEGVLSEVSPTSEQEEVTTKSSMSVSDATDVGHIHDSFCYEGEVKSGCIKLPSNPQAEDKEDSETVATSPTSFSGEKDDSDTVATPLWFWRCNSCGWKDNKDRFNFCGNCGSSRSKCKAVSSEAPIMLTA